jgi:hypothetical protein
MVSIYCFYILKINVLNVKLEVQDSILYFTVL